MTMTTPSTSPISSSAPQDAPDSPSLPSIASLRRGAAAQLGIPLERLPRHIAVIMDGNGRWANQRGLPRLEGHKTGAEAVRRTITECGRLGIEVLTLYSFSQENWKRPAEEVDGLMSLALHHLVAEREDLIRNNVRFRAIGRRDRLSPAVLHELDATRDATAHGTGLTLLLAINYGSRAEIVDACRSLARDVADGRLAPDQIDESLLASRLDTAGLPDPDLLIRTAGERRLSNYLLWQLSYAEIHVTDVLWPDFGVAELHEAILDYAGRERRFGAVPTKS